MKTFTINTPIFPTAGMLKTIEAHCAHLRELGYDASAKPHNCDGADGVWLKVYKDNAALIDETHRLTAEYTAEFARFAGRAHFQFALEANVERIADIGGTVVISDSNELAVIDWPDDEPSKFFPTYGDTRLFLDTLDRQEVKYLMGKATNLFAEIGWRRGANEDCYVWFKEDHGFDTVALNDPQAARELIKEAEERLVEKQAAKIAEDM